MIRRTLAATLAALVAAGAAAGCSDDDPSPSVRVSADAFTPASKADLAAKIEARLPAVKDVPPERTSEFHALTTACVEIGRMERAVTDDVATRLGIGASVRTDLRIAAQQCGTAPAAAAVALNGVVAALRAG